jgi:small-conductance mechanosensitive channel
MKTHQSNLFYLVLTILVLVLPSQAHGRIKCWTNNEGVKECGNVIPPEYAQKGHEEVSDQGVVVEEQERAKTEEELAEEKRLADIKAEETRKAEAQAKQDKMLMDTFSSIDDIEMTRDGKIAAIESSVKLTNTRNEKIQTDLDKRIEAAAVEERAGKTPSESLLKDIESLRRQIKNNEAYITKKRAEQEQLRADYALDIARFNKLKPGAE